MGIVLKIGDEKKESSNTYSLNIRKTIDGNIMIRDHEYIDIVISISSGKVIAFVKDLMDDKVYDTQNRLFKFLTRKGIIDPASVHAGNVYGSMEGKVLEKSSSLSLNISDLLILNIAKWMEEEKPYFEFAKALEEEEEERLLEPSEEDTTELGEIPHPEKEKLDSVVTKVY